MRVLVACEFSGVVRDAFKAMGHDVWSCDLRPTLSPGQHIIGDAVEVAYKRPWDLMIAHPPCTHLSVSGARWFKDKQREQVQAAGFFILLATAPIPRICVENPVSIMSTWYRKPDQIIQPYQFGHDASKRTCLWLEGLPKLRSTVFVKPRLVDGKERWANQTDSGQNRLTPSETRADERSITYSGIALAMALQWGTL